MAKTGAVLDALVASGSNQIGGISFSIHDPKPLLAQARADAVKDAIDRAGDLCQGRRRDAGPILSIQEARQRAAAAALQLDDEAMFAAAPPPVAGGEESVSASVSITWIIQ